MAEDVTKEQIDSWNGPLYPRINIDKITHKELVPNNINPDDLDDNDPRKAVFTEIRRLESLRGTFTSSDVDASGTDGDTDSGTTGSWTAVWRYTYNNTSIVGNGSGTTRAEAIASAATDGNNQITTIINGQINWYLNNMPMSPDGSQPLHPDYFERGPELGPITNGPRTPYSGVKNNYNTDTTSGPQQGYDIYQEGRDGQINNRWNRNDNLAVCKYHRGLDYDRSKNLLYHIPFKETGDLIRAADLNNLKTKLQKQIDIWNAEIDDTLDRSVEKVARAKLLNRMEEIKKRPSENLNSPINTNNQALSVYKIDTTSEFTGKRRLFGDISHVDLTGREGPDLVESFDIQIGMIPIFYCVDESVPRPFSHNHKLAEYTICQYRSVTNDLEFKIVVQKRDFVQGGQNIKFELNMFFEGERHIQGKEIYVELPELIVGERNEIDIDSEKDFADFDRLNFSIIYIDGHLSLWVAKNDDPFDLIDNPGEKIATYELNLPSIQDGTFVVGGSLNEPDKLNGDEFTPMVLKTLSINRNQHKDYAQRLIRWNPRSYENGQFESKSKDRVKMDMFVPDKAYRNTGDISTTYKQLKRDIVGAREYPIITPEYWIKAKVTLETYITSLDNLIIPGQSDPDTDIAISQFKNLHVAYGPGSPDEPSTRFMQYEPISGHLITVGFYNTLVEAYNLIVTNCICNSDCACNQNCACNVNCNCNYSDKRLKEIIPEDELLRTEKDIEVDEIDKKTELKMLKEIQELLKPKVWRYKDFEVYTKNGDRVTPRNVNPLRTMFGPIAQDLLRVQELLGGLYCINVELVQIDKNFVKVPGENRKQYYIVDNQQVNECRIWIDNKAMETEAEINKHLLRDLRSMDPGIIEPLNHIFNKDSMGTIYQKDQDNKNKLILANPDDAVAIYDNHNHTTIKLIEGCTVKNPKPKDKNV